MKKLLPLALLITCIVSCSPKVYPVQSCNLVADQNNTITLRSSGFGKQKVESLDGTHWKQYYLGVSLVLSIHLLWLALMKNKCVKLIRAILKSFLKMEGTRVSLCPLFLFQITLGQSIKHGLSQPT